jgi:hypothetical protein
MLRSLDRHCKERELDGSSNIDPTRSHLNSVLVGNPAGVLASLDDFYEDGPARPAKQSESPYLRVVVSASPSYFRPENPEAEGEYDEGRLKTWVEATMDALKAEHGEDLLYAELHLDEDTPHIHAVLAPTYQKKPRVPGKRKRNEDEAGFEARKQAARDAVGVRTVGRSSHPELSKKGSFQRLRERMAVALTPLGIQYGEDRAVGAPKGKSTRQWVKEEAQRIKDAEVDFEKEKSKNLMRDARNRENLEEEKSTLKVSQEKLEEEKSTLKVSQEKLEEEKSTLKVSQENLEEEKSTLKVSQEKLEEEKLALDLSKKLHKIQKKELSDEIRKFNKVKDLYTSFIDRFTNIVRSMSQARGIHIPDIVNDIEDMKSMISGLEQEDQEDLLDIKNNNSDHNNDLNM